MGDANPIRTLGYYSNPSHEGYRTPLSSLTGTMWCLFDPTPSGWCKTDAHSTDFGKNAPVFISLSEAWTRFKDLLQKVPHHGIDIWLQVQIFYDHVNPVTRRTIDQSAGGKFRDRNVISLHQDVPSTSGHRLIELENQLQRLMEAHLAPMQPTQVSLRTDEAGGLVYIFMASQDTRLSKFEADFKQQQRKMTNKIDTVLKAIIDRIAGALPSYTVKNLKLNVNSTTSVLSAHSYQTKDPQCSTQIHSSINAITGRTIRYTTTGAENPTPIDKIGYSGNDEEIEWSCVKEPLDLVDTSEKSIYESLIKEMPKCSLNYDIRIKKGDPRNLKIPYMIGHKFTTNTYIDADLPMNIMSLAYYNSVRKNRYEYRIRNFVRLGKVMYVFVGNMSYVMDFTILENIKTNIDPSLSHVVFGRPFVEIACLAINRKYGLMTFTDGTKDIIFKTPYKDPKRSKLSIEGHDLLSSRIILSKDDYDRRCRKPSDLEDRFYRDTIKLEPEYLTGVVDEEEVT
ncbi:hypothetical protein Tco_0418865 [Tanacetum coccineum]